VAQRRTAVEDLVVSPPPPRVTVAIPTWNREHLLPAAIDSVLRQSLGELEVIVLDNASTDRTSAIVRPYLADPRVSYLQRPSNIGHRANMTAALHAGRAPYVTILHDKEEMYADNLARKVAFLDTHPEAALVHGGFRIVDGEGREVEPHRRGRPGAGDRVEDSTTFLRSMVSAIGGVQHISSVVVRRSVLGGEGFRDEDAPADDVALWLRLGAKGQVGYVGGAQTLLRAAPGWSSGNSYLEIHNGRFYPTVLAVQGGRDARLRFLARAELSRRDRLALALTTRTWAQRQLVSIIRRAAPGCRAGVLRQAVRIEPTLAASPLLALALRSYASVEGAAPAVGARQRSMR